MWLRCEQTWGKIAAILNSEVERIGNRKARAEAISPNPWR
jgi:hypothetical protein